MKLKQSPDDFHVTELTRRTCGSGPFAFYSLEKTGWTTPDAIAAVRRRWDIADARRISFGGLKDRHAVTRQHFTIYRGPARNLSHHGVSVAFLGMTDAPFSSRDIAGNRFRITIRDLPAREARAASGRVPALIAHGVPNYFDDQRFGSTDGGEFIARLLILGRFEEALKLALTQPYEYDKASVRDEKASLAGLWGRWPELKAVLPRGHARSLIDYLTGHPSDFRGVIERLRPELQGLYLSAYQSFLWNRMLAALITEVVPGERLRTFRLKLGPVPTPPTLTAEEASRLGVDLPLPSARVQLPPNSPWRKLIDNALADQGFTLPEMKVPGVRRPFFSRGDRPAWVVPSGVSAEVAGDERHAGKRRLNLVFDLPRGSYATIVVKQLTQTDAYPAAP